MRRRIRSLLMVVVFALAILPVLNGVAHAVHDGANVFELDGDVADSPAGGPTDWAALFNSSGAKILPLAGGATAAVFAADHATPDASYFQGGGSKDINPISDYNCTTVNNPTDKNEILNAYAVAFEPTTGLDAGDLIVYFGLERFDNDGDANVGFWLFQNPVGCTASGGGGTPFTGSKTPGDLLIVSEFTNGGTVSTINVYKWIDPPGPVTGAIDPTPIASGVDCATTPPGSDDACAIVNGGNITTPWFTTDKDGTGPNTLAVSEFFEGGVNVSDLVAGFGGCFTGFLAETRTSQELTAQLKDYALAAFNTCEPDLKIQKSASAGTVNAGDSFTYTIDVHNDGDGQAENVVVTDDLDDDLVVNSAVFDVDPNTGGGTGDCSVGAGNTITCPQSGTITLAAADGNTTGPEPDALRVTITVTAPVAACGVVTNTSTVDADNQGAVDSNEVIVTVQCPGLSIQKTTSTPSVDAGQPISYTITVSNSSAPGTGTATGVSINDPLPGSGNLNWTITSATDPTKCSISAGTLSCSNITLAPGASFGVTVSTPTDAADCGTYNNTATFDSTNDGTGSAGPVQIVVNCAPDVGVVKSTGTPSVAAGASVAYSITVTAGGTGLSEGVTLTDVLPTGLVWTVGGPNAGDCSPASPIAGGTTLTCAFGTMAPGDTRTITLTATTTTANCPSISNTATVSARSDTNAGNNSSGPITISVSCPPPPPPSQAGINIVKDGPTLAHVGDTVTYTLTVTATTGVPLSAVVVTDPICSAPAIFLGGDLNANTILDPGEVWTYTCSHVVLASDPDPLPNTATAQGVGAGQLVSDTDDHSVDIIHPAITVVKTANPVSGTPGTSITYTYVVTNTGDTTLFNVSIDDDKLGHIGDIAELDPGESVTLTKTTTLGNAAVTNVATAVGSDVLGKAVQADDSASVTAVLPLKLPKTGTNPYAGIELGFAFIGLGFVLMGLSRRERVGLARPSGPGSLIGIHVPVRPLERRRRRWRTTGPPRRAGPP